MRWGVKVSHVQEGRGQRGRKMYASGFEMKTKKTEQKSIAIDRHMERKENRDNIVRTWMLKPQLQTENEKIS